MMSHSRCHGCVHLRIGPKGFECRYAGLCPHKFAKDGKPPCYRTPEDRMHRETRDR